MSRIGELCSAVKSGTNVLSQLRQDLARDAKHAQRFEESREAVAGNPCVALRVQDVDHHIEHLNGLDVQASQDASHLVDPIRGSARLLACRS